MGWGAGLVLVALRAISLCLQPGAASAAAEDGLPPIISPILNGLCDAVECGKGRCRANLDHAFGFVCDCDQGWTKFHLGDHLQFLPCIVPNCTFDYSCSDGAKAPAPSPLPPRPDWSLFDPCTWSFCGEGTCVKTSDFGHRCECSPGYDNLLNATSFPCFRDCALGADCARLGIEVPTGPPPSSTSQPNSAGSPPNRGESDMNGYQQNYSAATKFPRSLLRIFLWTASLAMIVRRI